MPVDLKQRLEKIRVAMDPEPSFHVAQGYLDRIVAELNRPLRVMVMGEFSTGKSSFINALLGEEVAEVSGEPTTAVITVFSYGSPSITVHNEDGTAHDIRVQDFQKFTSTISGSEQTRTSVRYVERHLEHPLLRKMVLIDSPGLNDTNKKRAEIAREFMSEAEAVLWIIAADQAATKREVDAVEALPPHLKPFLILNKIDMIDPEEEGGDEDDEEAILSAFATDIEEKFHGQVREILPVSAYYAMEGKRRNDARLQAAGHLEDVVNRLERCAAEETGARRQSTVLWQLSTFVLEFAQERDSLVERIQSFRTAAPERYTEIMGNVQAIEGNLGKSLEQECSDGLAQSLCTTAATCLQAACLIAGVSPSSRRVFVEDKLGSLAEYQKEAAYVLALFRKKNHRAGSGAMIAKAAELGSVDAMALSPSPLDRKRAAELGNVHAQAELGRTDDAYLEQAAKRHEPSAVVLWAAHERESDPKTSFEFYCLAARQHMPQSYFALGVFYRNGDVVEQNFRQAYAWFSWAATYPEDAGRAMMEMALCLYEGKGVEQNHVRAYILLKQLIQSGYTNAKTVRDRLFQSGSADVLIEMGRAVAQGLVPTHLLDKDETSAMWYRLASEAGSAEGARLYAQEHLAAGHLLSALNQFALAAQRGSEEAAKERTEIFRTCMKDIEKARTDKNIEKWHQIIEDAEQQKIPEAARLLGIYEREQCHYHEAKSHYELAYHWSNNQEDQDDAYRMEALPHMIRGDNFLGQKAFGSAIREYRAAKKCYLMIPSIAQMSKAEQDRMQVSKNILEAKKQRHQERVDNFETAVIILVLLGIVIGILYALYYFRAPIFSFLSDVWYIMKKHPVISSVVVLFGSTGLIEVTTGKKAFSTLFEKTCEAIGVVIGVIGTIIFFGVILAILAVVFH